MLDREEAVRRAAKFLAEESRTWGQSSNVRIISEHCFTDKGRFIAPYDHVEYFDHGRQDMQLGGNLPVAVDLNTGACSFITWEEADDLFPADDNLTLEMEEAADLAQKFLDEEVSHEGMTFALVEGDRVEVAGTFYFDCQSVAYIKSGNPRDMAIGTGYVCVDGATGECRMLGATESARLDLF